MCEITIPSSPSWYLSNILGVNDDGTALAYGAKHELVILQPSSMPGKLFESQPIFIPMAHRDKITAVAFAPLSSDQFKSHVASCSDDGSVHVWNWSTQALQFSHSGHPEGQKLVGVDWSRADTNFIVSVSDGATVVCWDLLSNTIRRLYIGPKVSPSCLAACPHDKDLVAIGAKNGLIVIFNVINDGHVRYRLRSHETDVVSLAWCPVPHNIFKPASNQDNTYLLASGAKDRAIYFWRVGSDGRYETFINLPTHPTASTGYRSKNGVGGPGNHWVCVRWPEANTLITSSLFGELLTYDLTNFYSENGSSGAQKKPKAKIPRLIHGNHTKGLFCIAVPNLKKGKETIVWSFALDKHLIASYFESAKVIGDLTTIGGIVYCMAASPLDPNRIAIGTGDNRIHVWNMSTDSYEGMQTFWNKINSKVMAIAWHPTQDSVLAFGTGEGRVGILDTSDSKPPVLLRLYHRRSVYSVIWSTPIVPFETQKGSKIALFTVGDGDIFQYNVDTPEKEPISLSPYLKKCDSSAVVSKTLGRTDLAWKPDRSLAAVGNDNGVLYIVDGRDFGHVHTIFAHKKLVQCVIWHPDTVTTENSISPCSSWLASASDNIQIVNVTERGVEIVACLNAHSERVVSLAWSPHFNGRLISASYDYTSQVWDVSTGSVLACFDGHHSAVVCCLPSALHQDCFITGSADNTVRMWSVNKFTLTKTKTKKQRLSGVLKKLSGVQEAVDTTPMNEQESVDQIGSNGFKPFAIKALATDAHRIEPTEKRKSKSMFPITSSGLNQARHLTTLWASLKGEPVTMKSVQETGYLDFFGDSKAISRLTTVEENHHKENDNSQFAQHLSLWSGDVAETIKTACLKKQLSDWLVSLAPMVSHKLWVDCCKCYAVQLAETGDPYKSASYFLAVHQTEEAVNVLIQAKLFREAVVLAKSRFPKDDVTVKKIMSAWGMHCVGTGAFNLAAHCMLSIGSNIEAAEVLARSKDPATLALASEVAYLAEAREMSLSLSMRAINTALETKDYETARATAEKNSILKDLVFWVDVCSFLPNWKPLKNSLVLDWISGNVQEKDKWPGLFHIAFEHCKKHLPSYSVLSKFLPNKPTPDSEAKVWAYIGGQISLAAAAQLNPSNSICVLRHLLQALEAAYTFHLHNPSNPHLFLQLSVWISPDGPLSILPMLDSTKKGLIESFCTFLACAVVHWLDLLNAQDEILSEDLECLPRVNVSVLKCAELLFNHDVMLYHKMDVELKKLENNLAAAKLKTLKTLKYCQDIEAVLQTEEPRENEHEDVSEKLVKIKAYKAKFEEDRLFAPNPFITYCTLRNIMQTIIKKHPESGKNTLAELTQLWEKSSADV